MSLEDNKEEEEDGVKLHMILEKSKIILCAIEIKRQRESPHSFLSLLEAKWFVANDRKKTEMK